MHAQSSTCVSSRLVHSRECPPGCHLCKLSCASTHTPISHSRGPIPNSPWPGSGLGIPSLNSQKAIMFMGFNPPFPSPFLPFSFPFLSFAFPSPPLQHIIKGPSFNHTVLAIILIFVISFVNAPDFGQKSISETHEIINWPRGPVLCSR